MSVSAAKFVSTMVMHFPVRHESPEREAEWLASVMASLKGYSADVLERACQRMIDTRTDRRFPLPAEIRRVCVGIIEADNAGKLPLDGPGATAPVWSGHRQRLADHLIMTEQGRRAAREGWILGLWHFAVREGRVPAAFEEKRLITAAEEMVEEYRKCVRGAAGPMSASLAVLGKSMLDRREALAKRVLGE